MKKVNIIGVPEHFNLPWHLAIEEGTFEDRGIDLQWTDIPEGTGRMCELLKNQETDLAIILTEGVLKSIAEGNPVKIVQEYIASPLLWGVHVAANSEFNKVSDLKDKKAAISRFGSGSHLMAFVNAQNEEWNTQKLRFEVVNTIEGGAKALTKGEADYFLWERFTTKPLVDGGIFRRLGDCPTPWPCFVIAASSKFVTANGDLLAHILEVINTFTVDFKRIPSIGQTLANRYNLKLGDVHEWLSLTQWSQRQLKPKVVDKVYRTLMDLDLVVKKISPAEVLS